VLLARRTLLLLPLAAVGCTRDPEPPSADDLLRAAAVEREQALLREYAELLAAAPALAGRLAPLAADHRSHLAALGGPSAGPSAGPSTPGAAPGPPPSTATVLRRLAGSSRTAADAHRAAALDAGDGALAALLASLAACEASHGVALA
jgi:hypothetical protein